MIPRMDEKPFMLSPLARSLWAKKSRPPVVGWLPLAVHMADSAEVAQHLWSDWLPEGTRRCIARGVEISDDQAVNGLTKEEWAERLLVFVCASHDLGKAIPAFQCKPSAFPETQLDFDLTERIRLNGLPLPEDGYRGFQDVSKSPHALASLLLMERFGCGKNVSAIAGAHHGKPASATALDYQQIVNYPKNYHMGAEGRKAWEDVQTEFFFFALHLAGFEDVRHLPRPDMVAQVLLSGLVTMADWIASNEGCFPYLDLNASWSEILNPDKRGERADKGWSALRLPPLWIAEEGYKGASLYEDRFPANIGKPFAPFPVQVLAAQAASQPGQPGILMIEAPMGQGKTEAALVAAEIFAFAAGRSGVFFALPTQATSDGMFPRIRRWAQQLDRSQRHSIRLAHGKAQFNEEYTRLFEGGSGVDVDEPENLTVHPWFEGQKKSLLADFVVGTIDQLLMAALKQKHVMLRHLGLAGKVVIIDECHAYDAYMNQYLERALNWLGAYQVPVILLSATLPREKRNQLIGAYLEHQALSEPIGQPIAFSETTCYPLVTWTDGMHVNAVVPTEKSPSRRVEIGGIRREDIAFFLKETLSGGGCAGVLLNTVKAAQEAAVSLKEVFGDAVELLHSRFIAPDRAEKERRLLNELGKQGLARPPLRVVVGTQVLEQSLDIDFDLMLTELCPMDLLMQRIGRLHRHDRERPEQLKAARCIIIDRDIESLDAGSAAIYGRYLLLKTKAFLPSDGWVMLPEDIPGLVEAVYRDSMIAPILHDEIEQAKAAHEHTLSDKKQRANSFRIDPVWPGDETQRLNDWLSTDVSDQRGEAAVRDGDASIDVLMLIQDSNGGLRLPLAQPDISPIPTGLTPKPELAREIARQIIRLPRALCARWAMRQTIEELEKISKERLSAWQLSPWLKGELFLLLDENREAHLNGYLIRYNAFDGLTYQKEEGGHGGQTV